MSSSWTGRRMTFWNQTLQVPSVFNLTPVWAVDWQHFKVTTRALGLVPRSCSSSKNPFNPTP
eukprot:3425063-Rhodomonas_salina.2